MNKITRKFNWVSSFDMNQLADLENLQKRLVDFYDNYKLYYSEIDFTSKYWDDNSQLLYQDLQNEIRKSEKVLEVGCGSANCLLNTKIIQKKYTGIDFSEELIKNNKHRYPGANFFSMSNPYNFPFEDESFELVFSVFVIEHTVFPAKFLKECLRVLRRNGKLIILTPNFLGCSNLPSQRVGFSAGTGRDKFKSGRILDAILTGYDNKIRIPVKMYFMKREVKKTPKFYINLSPICFVDAFTPDVDAVYITYENEIQEYLKSHISWQNLLGDKKDFAENNKLIYMKGIKTKN